MLLPGVQFMPFAEFQIKLSPFLVFATLVSVLWDIASGDVDVCCEESEVGVDISGVAPSPSAAIKLVSEHFAMEDKYVYEESEITLDIPHHVVVPSAALKCDYENIATEMWMCMRSLGLLRTCLRPFLLLYRCLYLKRLQRI